MEQRPGPSDPKTCSPREPGGGGGRGEGFPAGGQQGRLNRSLQGEEALLAEGAARVRARSRCSAVQCGAFLEGGTEQVQSRLGWIGGHEQKLLIRVCEGGWSATSQQPRNHGGLRFEGSLGGASSVSSCPSSCHVGYRFCPCPFLCWKCRLPHIFYLNNSSFPSRANAPSARADFWMHSVAISLSLCVLPR